MSTLTGTVPTAAAPDDGRGPHGMWWVAWRLHRRLVVGWLVGVALVVAALFWVQRAYSSAATTAPCLADLSADGRPICPNPVFLAFLDHYGWWQAVQWALVVAPAVIGVIGGVGLFGVDFDRRTHVLVLSQSVGRLWWFGVSLVVVCVPLVLGAAALGTAVAGMQEITAGFGVGWYDPFRFSGSGVMAAGICLLGLAIGSLTGLATRSPLQAALIGLVALVAVVGALLMLRPHLITPVRVTTPLSSRGYVEVPLDSWTTGSGLLDSNGSEADYPQCDNATGTADWDRCFEANDITAYWADFVPFDRRAQLQLAVAGAESAGAALLFVAGALVLRRRSL